MMNLATRPPLPPDAPARAPARIRRGRSADRDSSSARTLVRSILDGDAAAGLWLLRDVKPEVSAFLNSQCWDARSRRLVPEIVDDLFSECFGGFGSTREGAPRQPLLLGYHGEASLATWLKRIARNRLISRLRSSEERRRVFPELDGSGGETFDRLPVLQREPVGGGGGGDGAASAVFASGTGEGHPLSEAMKEAILEARDRNPGDFALLALHFLHGVPKNRLADAWGLEPCTVGRKIERSLARVRQSLRSKADDPPRGVRYDAEDFLEAGGLRVLTCGEFPSKASHKQEGRALR